MILSVILVMFLMVLVVAFFLMGSVVYSHRVYIVQKPNRIKQET